MLTILIVALVLLAIGGGYYYYNKKNSNISNNNTTSLKVFEAKYKFGVELDLPYYFARIYSLSDKDKDILKQSFNVRDIALSEFNYLLWFKVDPAKVDIDKLKMSRNFDDLISNGLQVECMKEIAQRTKNSDDCYFIINLMLLKNKTSSSINMLSTPSPDTITNYLISITGVSSEGQAITRVLEGFGPYNLNSDFYNSIIENIKA